MPLSSFFLLVRRVVFNSEILIKIFFILLVPFALGQLFHSKMAKDLEHYSSVVWWAERLPIAIAVCSLMSASANDDVWNNIEITYWFLTVATVFFFCFLPCLVLGSWQLLLAKIGVIGLHSSLLETRKVLQSVLYSSFNFRAKNSRYHIDTFDNIPLCSAGCRSPYCNLAQIAELNVILLFFCLNLYL